jgi:hypothetical protein
MRLKEARLAPLSWKILNLKYGNRKNIHPGNYSPDGRDITGFKP